jgi:hypothetical protein
MTRRMLILLAVVAVSGATTLGAHEGHAHSIMGTITAVHDNQLELQTKDGKKVSVTLNDKTTILRGKVKADTTDLKEGVRVVVEPVSEKQPMVAKTVTLGPSTPKPKAPTDPK